MDEQTRARLVALAEEWRKYSHYLDGLAVGSPSEHDKHGFEMSAITHTKCANALDEMTGVDTAGT
jgi:hypothetical protein